MGIISSIKKLFKKRAYDIQNLGDIPSHIAIIMDGNGRWAKKRRLPRKFGHLEGVKALNKIVLFCDDIKIKHLTVYAFSTENWNRPKSEVDLLMEMLYDYLKDFRKYIGDRNIRINVIGDIERFSDKLKGEIQRVILSTKQNDGFFFNIALNYGSRNEITNSLKQIVKDIGDGKLVAKDINEKTIQNYLYTKDIPDPDLIIRTSGEKRLSNFLLWQASYSELYFTDVLWPDFGEKDLMEAVEDYKKRKRRFGGL